MINKRGQVGSSVVTMYRVLVIIFISVIVLGISSLVYSHYINVKDSEAVILARQMVECVAPLGILDLDSLSKEKNIFTYCGFEDFEVERFFVSILAKVDDEEVGKLIGGDEGFLWVREIYESGAKTDSIKRYEPGYFNAQYSVYVLDGGVEKMGDMIVEVIINYGE